MNAIMHQRGDRMEPKPFVLTPMLHQISQIGPKNVKNYRLVQYSSLELVLKLLIKGPIFSGWA
jgi:hypothetical protein